MADEEGERLEGRGVRKEWEVRLEWLGSRGGKGGLAVIGSQAARSLGHSNRSLGYKREDCDHGHDYGMIGGSTGRAGAWRWIWMRGVERQGCGR